MIFRQIQFGICFFKTTQRRHRRITVSKKTVRIGDFCRKEILKGTKAGKIVKKAHKRANGHNVNAKHVAWYVWDMKQESSKHFTTDLPSRYAS